jgi:hypothetical protein
MRWKRRGSTQETETLLETVSLFRFHEGFRQSFQGGCCIGHDTFASHLLRKHGQEEYSFDFGNGKRLQALYKSYSEYVDANATCCIFRKPNPSDVLSVSTTGFDRVCNLVISHDINHMNRL